MVRRENSGRRGVGVEGPDSDPDPDPDADAVELALELVDLEKVEAVTPALTRERKGEAEVTGEVAAAVPPRAMRERGPTDTLPTPPWCLALKARGKGRTAGARARGRALSRVMASIAARGGRGWIVRAGWGCGVVVVRAFSGCVLCV